VRRCQNDSFDDIDTSSRLIFGYWQKVDSCQANFEFDSERRIFQPYGGERSAKDKA
jgi:hypothetical protein